MCMLTDSEGRAATREDSNFTLFSAALDTEREEADCGSFMIYIMKVIFRRRGEARGIKKPERNECA